MALRTSAVFRTILSYLPLMLQESIPQRANPQSQPGTQCPPISAANSLRPTTHGARLQGRGNADGRVALVAMAACRSCLITSRCTAQQAAPSPRLALFSVLQNRFTGFNFVSLEGTGMNESFWNQNTVPAREVQQSSTNLVVGL